MKSSLLCRVFHRHKYPLLFIACCPKSASTWFAHLVAESTKCYRYYHPKCFLEEYSDPKNELTERCDITPAVLQELKGKCRVVRAHTAPSPENVATMNKVFKKFIFLTRDLRDVAVSLYYHLHQYEKSAFIDLGNSRPVPWVRMPAEARSMPKKECIDLIIERMLPGFITLVRNWLQIIDKQDNILLLRYEDVTTQAEAELKRVLNFFAIPADTAAMNAALQAYDKSRMVRGQLKFRKGGSGGWRDELTPQQADRIAGLTGDIMERLNHDGGAQQKKRAG